MERGEQWYKQLVISQTRSCRTSNMRSIYFDNKNIPRPDVFLAQHIIPGPAGTVFSKEGPTLAGSDSIEIIVHGRSAHGSMPHTTIDPTYVAAMIVVRLQGIVGREIPPGEFAVASVGTLEAGHSNNIIPGEARIVVNCRTYDESVRERLNAAIERVVRAECAASGLYVPGLPVALKLGHYFVVLT